jgi:Uma2 family endonuclease
MTTAATPLPTATLSPTAGRWETVADLLHQLGDIPAKRVRWSPTPGAVTFEQFVELHEKRRWMVCEWVDGTLVEKALGQHESWLTFIIIGEMYRYMEEHDPGMFLPPDGVLRILPGIARAPDVAFIARTSLPGERPPPRSDKVSAVVPDLAVEVLSASNTKREMERKRREYFQAGVKLVWEIDPETRAANVYTAADRVTPVPVGGTLDGGDVLPGFRLSLQALFDRADRQSRRAEGTG